MSKFSRGFLVLSMNEIGLSFIFPFLTNSPDPPSVFNLKSENITSPEIVTCSSVI